MVPALIFLLSVVGLIALVAYSSHRTAERKRLWAALAERRGLSWEPGGWLTHPGIRGEIGGYPVEIGIQMRNQGKSSVAYTAVRARPLRPLPADLRITQEGLLTGLGKLLGAQDFTINDPYLDKKLQLKSTDPDTTRALFADPALRAAAAVLTGPCPYTRLDEGAVIVEARGMIGSELSEVLDGTVRLAAALDSARLTPWRAVCGRLGLSLTDEGRRLILSGSHRGRRVILTVDLAASRTYIDVPVDGLPAGLAITAERRDDAIRLSDPVLDGMVSVTGGAPDALRALLRDDDLRGELLSVVHAWPGSEVRSEGVRLVMPGSAAQGLDARLEEATTLAARLTARLDAARKTASRQPDRQTT